MGQKSLSVQDDYYIFPIGEVYYVKFRDPVSRVILSKKSSGYRNKTLAGQWAREEWQRRCSLAGLPDTPLGDYAKLFFTGNDDDPYENKVRANGGHLAVKARRNYRSDLEKYILPDPICQKSIPLIKRNDSIDFRDRLIALFGFSRKTKRIFQAYKNVIHTALEKGLTQIDSVQRLNVAYTKQKRPATTIQNIKMLLEEKNWANPRIRLAVITAGMTGLRAGEIRGIKWRDIDNEHNVIRVDREIVEFEGEKLPKWEKTRITIYPSILKALLEPLRGNPDDRVFAISKRGPLSYNRLREGMNEAVIKAGIPHITMHGLRHSIQTALRGRGVNPELLRATFGWTDEDVQENYTHRELYDLSPQMEQTDSLFKGLTEEKGRDQNGKTGNTTKHV
jgi:integrase